MKKKEICIEPDITTVGDLRKLDIPDDVEIKINSVYDSEHEEYVPVPCAGFYHEKDNKIYLTPDTISI